MATDKEPEVSAAAEQPLPATEEEAKPPQAGKPVKEKKAKAPREKKPKQAKTASHPPYFQMIEEALLALNEKNGSSPYAIAKYMEEKHKAVLPENFKKILGLQLKNSAARGKLMKIKASYKLSEAASNKEKKENKRVSKAAKDGEKESKINLRGSTRKTRSVNKAEALKKSSAPSTTKKVGGGKKAKKATSAKPKQPKSIKSPAAKRSKKAAAVASAS